MRRREEVRRFHVDHDISCETQLLELVSLSSIVHLVFSSLRVYLPFSLCVVLLTTVYLHRHVQLRPTMFLRFDAHSAMAQEKVPFSHTSAHEEQILSRNSRQRLLRICIEETERARQLKTDELHAQQKDKPLQGISSCLRFKSCKTW